MSKPESPGREALRQALATKENADLAVTKAIEALERGQGVLNQVQREYRIAEDAATKADKAAAGDLASRLKSNLSDSPALSTSEQQLAARRAKAEAEAKHDNARAVHTLLADELQDAQQAAEDAEKAVRAAIAAICRDEATAMGERLRQVREEARQIEAQIHGLGYLGANNFPGQHDRPEYLPRSVVAILHQRPTPVDIGAPEAQAEKGRWLAYIDSLRENPEACRAEIEAPAPRPPELTPLVRAMMSVPPGRWEEGHRFIPTDPQ